MIPRNFLKQENVPDLSVATWCFVYFSMNYLKWISWFMDHQHLEIMKELFLEVQGIAQVVADHPAQSHLSTETQ